jgi:hypothetical protein
MTPRGWRRRSRGRASLRTRWCRRSSEIQSCLRRRSSRISGPKLAILRRCPDRGSALHRLLLRRYVFCVAGMWSEQGRPRQFGRRWQKRIVVLPRPRRLVFFWARRREWERGEDLCRAAGSLRYQYSATSWAQPLLRDLRRRGRSLLPVLRRRRCAFTSSTGLLRRRSLFRRRQARRLLRLLRRR